MGLLSGSKNGLTMHGTRSERRLMTQQRGRGAGRRDSRGALGPASRHGKATPKNPGRAVKGGWW